MACSNDLSGNPEAPRKAYEGVESPTQYKGDNDMKTRVRREDDRVWLKGVSGWFVGDRESSVHAAEAAVMEAVGEDVAYEYMLGVSGLAFRTQVSMDGLCPSSPHSFCGYQCHARSSKALPWKLKIFEAKPEDAEGVAKARQAVVESIERGVPVQYGSEEDGIIVGYQKGGEEWICFHPMREGGTKTFVETTWPWGIAVFTEPKKEMPSRRELARGALEQAVEMAKTEKAEGYHVGLAAWDAYLERLRVLQEADEETRKGDMLGNSWIYECLAQYRGAAAQYLRDVAGEFESQAADHLLKAADLYERMSNEVLRDKEHCVVTIAPLPWALKEGETWTNKMRQDQIARLEAALPLEREALKEIESALTQ
jgi:hypothetical protein